jgi:hypothetical protein
MILEPASDVVYRSDWPVVLAGQGFWREWGRPEWEQLAWYVDGVSQAVAYGRRAEVVLAPGEHTVVLEAGDEEHRGRAEVVITVQ